MVVEFKKEQLIGAVKWLKDCDEKVDLGSTIKSPELLYHPAWPEYIFIRYKRIKYLASVDDFEKKTQFVMINAIGERIDMSLHWPDRDLRAGIIGGLEPFKLENAKAID